MEYDMAEKQKMRADQMLVSLGLAGSREKAQALIMAGLVYLDEVQVRKPSTPVKDTDHLIVRTPKVSYVSRGALKLVKGLDAFGVDPAERIAMDVGASTGGFTDVLLQRGAAHVYSIDVGYGQLDWKIRNDPRVTVMERTNARYLTTDMIEMKPSLCVMDVSFISITKILPGICGIIGDEGEIITLIKPQFEAGREHVGKKGVVRDAAVHEMVIRNILEFVSGTLLWTCKALTFSPIRGPEGNIEFLAHLVKSSEQRIGDDEVRRVVSEAHSTLSEEN